MIAFRVFDHYGFLSWQSFGKIILSCDDNAHLPDCDAAVLYLARKFQFGRNNILWRDEYYEGIVSEAPAAPALNGTCWGKQHYKIELIRRLLMDYQINSPCHHPECD